MSVIMETGKRIDSENDDEVHSGEVMKKTMIIKIARNIMITIMIKVSTK